MSPQTTAVASSQLVRLSVQWESERIDVGVPGGVPVAEVLPSLTRRLRMLDGASASAGFRLVHADGTPLDHLEGSTQAANLSRIAQRGRRGAMGYRSRMLGREAMYRRSLALRAAVADGWDDERIARSLASVDENQLALF